MKKVYEKPYAYIETFELSQSIASCEFNVRGSQDVVNCYAVGDEYGTAKLFLSTGTCEVIEEGYCNYNAADATPVFSSY